MRRGLVLKKSCFLVHLDEYLKKFWAEERCWLAELADMGAWLLFGMSHWGIPPSKVHFLVFLTGLTEHCTSQDSLEQH